MTTLLDKAVAELRKLPADVQDAYAQALLEALPGENGTYQLSDEDRRAIEASRAQAERGEFVPDAEVEAFWRMLKK